MSYYAPIQQALRDINSQMNINWEQKRKLENDVFQAGLQRLKLDAEMSDPARKLQILQAQEQLSPEPIYLPSNFKEGSLGYKEEQKMWGDTLRLSTGYEGQVFRDANGYAVDANGELITDYKARARETSAAMAMKHFQKFGQYSGAAERQEIRDIDAQIYNIKKAGSQGTTQLVKDGQLQKLKSRKKELEATLNNPVRRMRDLRGRKDNLMYYMNQLRSQGFQSEHLAWANDMLDSLDKEMSDLIDLQTAQVKASGESAMDMDDIVKLQKYYDSLTDDIRRDTLKLTVLEHAQKEGDVEEAMLDKAMASMSDEDAKELEAILVSKNLKPAINRLKFNIKARQNQISRNPFMQNMWEQDKGSFQLEQVRQQIDSLGLGEVSPEIEKKLKANPSAVTPEILDFYKNYSRRDNRH